jgi:hypothetical protein
MIAHAVVADGDLHAAATSRMLGDVEVNDSSAVVEKDDEDEQDSASDGRYGRSLTPSLG